MKTLVAFLLVLMSPPMWGWILPFQGSGETPGAVGDLLKKQNAFGNRGWPPFFPKAEPVPLEGMDGNSAEFDIDAEPEEFEIDLDGEGIVPEIEDAESGSGEDVRLDLDSNEIQTDTAANRKEGSQSLSGTMQNLLPKQILKWFDGAPLVMDEFFKKERENILRLELELNRIMNKTLSDVANFNGTTTNTTDVVEDSQGNKYKVETVLKKGDHNQTLIVETIESLLDSNRTKRSNWFAEPAQ